MKLIKICLLLLTVFTANFAFAGEPASNLPDPPKLKIIQGGGGYFPPAANDVKYGAVVTDGAKVAKIIPSVVKVASFASRASNAIGLVQLAYEGIMSGVDYVLDPANNSVRFTPRIDSGAYCFDGACYSDISTAAEAVRLAHYKYNLSYWGSNAGVKVVVLSTNNDIVNLRFTKYYSPDDGAWGYFSVDLTPHKSTSISLPLSDVATNLQNKANTGDVAAQTLINQVVQDMINKNDDEILTALKAPGAVPYILPVTNPSTNPDGSPNPAYDPQKDPYGVPLPVTNPVKNPDGSPNPNYNPQQDPYGVPLPVTNPVKNPDGSPNPNYNPQQDPYGVPLPVTNPSTNPDGSPASGAKPFELPAFCSWASSVCEWQEWTKEKYDDTVKSVKDTYKEIKEFFTDDPPNPSDEDQIVKDQDNVDIATAEKSYISFPAYCPVNPSFAFLGSVIVFPLNLICEGVAQFKIVIIAFAYLKALFIIGNAVRN